MSNEHYTVLDIETKESFQSAGSADPTLLTVSVVGVYQSVTDRYFSLTEDRLSDLWPVLEQADRVIGFNLIGFDYPVLQKYYHGNLANLPTLDILVEFKKEHGFRIKLDNLAKDTLGEGKSGDGLQAIRLFAQGKIDELSRYCLDDVRLTNQLFLRGRDGHDLYYLDQGERRSWSVDWSIRPKGDLGTVTLPF